VPAGGLGRPEAGGAAAAIPSPGLPSPAPPHEHNAKSVTPGALWGHPLEPPNSDAGRTLESLSYASLGFVRGWLFSHNGGSAPPRQDQSDPRQRGCGYVLAEDPDAEHTTATTGSRSVTVDAMVPPSLAGENHLARPS
jgi:hypothetical protein